MTEAAERRTLSADERKDLLSRLTWQARIGAATLGFFASIPLVVAAVLLLSGRNDNVGAMVQIASLSIPLLLLAGLVHYLGTSSARRLCDGPLSRAEARITGYSPPGEGPAMLSLEVSLPSGRVGSCRLSVFGWQGPTTAGSAVAVWTDPREQHVIPEWRGDTSWNRLSPGRVGMP